MNLAVRHDFKDGVYRRMRHPAGWLSLHMSDIQVCRIVATARVHIEAVPLPFSIRDGYRAPAGHENSIANKRRIRYFRRYSLVQNFELATVGAYLRDSSCFILCSSFSMRSSTCCFSCASFRADSVSTGTV